jgi:error-prone DNA polymerase
MKFVPVKTVEQQAILAIHSVRALLVKQQTMLSNAMRGLAAEFGLIVAKGMDKLDDLMALVKADESVPPYARQAAQELLDQNETLGERTETLDSEIVAHARQDERARRLATIPGVGPITASLIAATVTDFSVFKRARDFAAWLGLVPRQHSTAGKTRLGKITKAGNREIRKCLVLGATSMTSRAPEWKSAAGVWTNRLLEQKRPFRLVTVALANKMARIAWALMTRGEVYHAQGRVVAAAEAVA